MRSRRQESKKLPQAAEQSPPASCRGTGVVEGRAEPLWALPPPHVLAYLTGKCQAGAQAGAQASLLFLLPLVNASPTSSQSHEQMPSKQRPDVKVPSHSLPCPHSPGPHKSRLAFPPWSWEYMCTPLQERHSADQPSSTGLISHATAALRLTPKAS